MHATTMFYTTNRLFNLYILNRIEGTHKLWQNIDLIFKAELWFLNNNPIFSKNGNKKLLKMNFWTR